MPAIPEFLLRKLFVPGSLKSTEAGFSFSLNNTFAPVTLAGLKLRMDDSAVDGDHILISLPDQPEISASTITPQNTFNLPVNILVGIKVAAPMVRKKLTISVDTREAGPLQFSIPMGEKSSQTGQGLNVFRQAHRYLRYNLRALKVLKDPQRPRLHFTPPANWMNDPNGLIYWQGNYHLFYQHNPNEATWGNIHWGHAISSDLLHWKHLPIALAPDPQGADAGGCFSGFAVDHDGIPTVIYTGVYPEVQCLATSTSPRLIKWQKHSQPVISAPPDGLQVEGFRDPCIWKEGTEWRMVLGSGIRGVGGTVLLYRSVNLIQWEYLGILFQGDQNMREPLWTGTMWECPSFFPLGDQWVLLLSVLAEGGGQYTVYYTGAYQDNRFSPQKGPCLLDEGAGGCFYAPQTLLDEDGRRMMMGWLREAREAEAQIRAGWSGTMSFPRLLSRSADGDLLCSPHPGIASFRADHFTLNGPAQPECQADTTGLEMLIHIPHKVEEWSGVIVSTVKQNQPSLRIGYNPEGQTLEVNCLDAGGLLSTVPIKSSPAAAVQLQVFLDGSVLEIYQNDMQPISARYYLPPSRSLNVKCFGSANIDLWPLKKKK